MPKTTLALRDACDEFTDAIGTWVWRRVVSERYGFTPTCWRTWSEHGCPMWNGRKPRHRQIKVRTPSRVEQRAYLLLEDVKEIIDAHAKPSTEWADRWEAEEEYGLSWNLLRRAYNRGDVQSELQYRMPRGNNAFARLREQRVFLREDIKTLLRARRRTLRPDARRITARQASERYGLTLEQISRAKRAGKLNPVREFLPMQDGEHSKRPRARSIARTRTQDTFHIGELESLTPRRRQGRPIPPSAPFNNHAGAWLTKSQVSAKYPKIPVMALQRARFCARRQNRPSGLSPIRAMLVKLTAGLATEDWVYHDDDCQKVQHALERPGVWNDDEGAWLTEEKASAKYGIPPHQITSNIRPRKKAIVPSSGSRHWRCWVYREVSILAWIEKCPRNRHNAHWGCWEQARSPARTQPGADSNRNAGARQDGYGIESGVGSWGGVDLHQIKQLARDQLMEIFRAIFAEFFGEFKTLFSDGFQRKVEAGKAPFDPAGRGQDFLDKLYDMKAFSREYRVSVDDVTKSLKLGGGDYLGVVATKLKDAELVDSRTGRGGGYWLTENGKALVEKLRPRPENPEKIHT